jgi:fructose transport system permease protein
MINDASRSQPLSTNKLNHQWSLSRSCGRAIRPFLHAHPTTIPFLVLALGIVFFSSFIGARFFAPFNLSLVLQQVTIIAMLGMAQTLIILTAGIDLSVGIIMILASTVMGRMAVVHGLPISLAFPLGLLAGTACGALNGLIIAMLRLPPFIVTLGTWSVFGALNMAYSRGETVSPQAVEAMAPFLHWTGTVIKPYDVFLTVFGIKAAWLQGSILTYGSIMMILVATIVWYVLNRTGFGRAVYATGHDPAAARRAGIDTSRTLLAVYTGAGLICALAGWMLIGSANPPAGQTANLDSIIAAVIGGASLFGGRGSIVGTLVGALIVGVFRNGLTLSGLDVMWQEFAVGGLIIIAVALDQWIRRGSS